MALRNAILRHIRVPVQTLGLNQSRIGFLGSIRSFSSHDDHLSKQDVVDRVLDVVKSFPKFDPSKDANGRMRLAASCKNFAVANNLKAGDSFEFELTWEDATPMLSMVCSKANEKEPVSTEPRSRVSSSATQNRCVTLALTAEDVKSCQLYLPREFMKDNGINKLGEMTVLGKNKTKWSAYLVSRDGDVALGNGWVDFCEANGVKLGESFTLKFIKERNTVPVLKFCSQER